jgi:hypothetical protein
LGQKSFNTLHKINVSLTWTNNIINKNYKWLSYVLWTTYLQFYKIINYYNSFITPLNFFTSNSFKISQVKKITWPKNQPRFSYSIDTYFIETPTNLIIINLYFYTTLVFYKTNTVQSKNLKSSNLKNNNLLLDNIEL